MNAIPLNLQVPRQEQSSRTLAALGLILPWVSIKALLLLPHFIVLIFLGIVAFFVAYISYWMVLITGTYPRALFDFGVGVVLWQLRMGAWYASLSDRYPPFNFSNESHPITLTIEYPENPSRLMALLGALVLIKPILLLPHLIIQYVTGTLIFVLLLFGFTIVLFRGSYDPSLFKLQVGLNRWNTLLSAYYFGWTDKYPPISIEAYS